MKEKSIFNWSGGKDSALALYKILQSDNYNVICLLTSISEQFQRVSMHGIRLELLETQVKNIGIPLEKIELPEMATMESYDKIMSLSLTKLKAKGATSSIFGDIFLEDLRIYREQQLKKLNLKAIFPLWKTSTKKLIHEFLDLGFKTIIVCVNEKYLDKSFLGRIIDTDFINDLPKSVDPCGENGEFHTFVFDGPIFRNPINFKKGEIVYRKYKPTKETQNSNYSCSDENNPFKYGFWYLDLIKTTE